MKQDYYLCLGITYTDKYEFPEKRFYWCSSADFKFKPFPSINDQHYAAFDSLSGLFSGDPNKVHISVVPEKVAGGEDGADAD